MGTEQQPAAQRWDGVVRRSLDFTVKSVDEAARSFEVVASTDTIDGHGDIVEQTFDLKRYKKNPVVLWLHNSFGYFDGARAEDFLPIGKAEGVKVSNGQLEAKIVFATEKANPLAEKIFNQVLEGTLRAVSIGFKPGTVTRTENNDTGKVTYRLANNELFEISVVPIPSNPDAVAKSLVSAERNELSRIAAKTAAEADPHKKAKSMDPEQLQKQLDQAKVDLGVKQAEVTKANERAATAETELATERTAGAKTKADLAIANERLEKAEKKIVEIEVDALIGKKITPAQREKFIKLRSAQGEKEFSEFVADMPELPTLTDVTKSDPVVGNKTAKTKGAPTKMAAFLNKAEG
jgi:HK97 family phage prohead protease